MKRPLQLSLAIALALGASNALALGLGPVHVKSKLNQPFEAEIPVIQGTAGEAEGLLVSLAGADEFERVGISRSQLSVPLEFALAKGSNGQLVVKVTSKEVVRESYLDFLVEANWPKGRLLREYTVLLDPPVTAPTRGVATAAPAASHAATTEPLRETHRERAATVAAAPRTAAKPAAAGAVAHKVAKGEYGPVEAGETLSAIARAARPGEGVSVNQMMLALLKDNPDAFYKDNINALKRGAILRIPSADEVKAANSASAAAAQVHAQIEDWRGGRASPTLVAGSAARNPAPAPAAPVRSPKAGASADKGGERLALVPPKAGKDSMAMADRPGSDTGSSAATSALKSELARTRETLTTREQETGELKSRVKELEDLKGKNDRLISLKDSEIAELQQKLKLLQEKTATSSNPAGTKPSSPTAPTATAPASPATPTTVVAAATKPAPAASKIDKQDIWGNADSGTSPTAAIKPDSAKPAASAAAAPATPPSAPPEPVVKTMPLASTPPITATPGPSNAPAMTAGHVDTAPKAPPARTGTMAVKPQPMAAVAPWYESPWLKPAALAAGIVLLLLGLLGLRKRKATPALADRGSLADAFSDSPLAASDGSSLPTVEAEEAELREQLQHDPSNVGLHLELLSLFYAERDVAKFEDEAAEMHAQVVDPHQPEWLEAQAMGQELAPHNPLFAGAAHYDGADAAVATAHTDTYGFDDHDERLHETDAAPASAYEPPAFDAHDHGTTDADPVLPVQAPAGALDDGFDFDGLPPLNPDADGADQIRDEPAMSAPPPQPDDDYFATEDAIGTKLDLAKAYMDMGDPEGARSMLEEVIAEGSEVQKAEAHRLIAEIH